MTNRPKQQIIQAPPINTYAEAWDDLQGRIGAIAKTLALTPIQHQIIAKMLLAEMSAALERASALKEWEVEQEKMRKP